MFAQPWSAADVAEMHALYAKVTIDLTDLMRRNPVAGRHVLKAIDAWLAPRDDGDS
jgi:hypothetical protein